MPHKHTQKQNLWRVILKPPPMTELHKTVPLTVAVVGDAPLVGSLEHQISALQTQFNVLKRSLAIIESNNFCSRNFRTSFSRSTSSPTSDPVTQRKRTSTRNVFCYKCRQKGHIARRCRSRVGNLDSYNSFHTQLKIEILNLNFNLNPNNQLIPYPLFLSTRTLFLFRFYFMVYHLMH